MRKLSVARPEAHAAYASMLEKTHPRLYPSITPEFAAVLGCVHQAHYTTPHLSYMRVTVSGVWGFYKDGDITMVVRLTEPDHLTRNLSDFLVLACLTPAERAAWDELYVAHVG
jgi:hypothetical protein